VLVTAALPPFAHSGDNADVTVSAIGDATSLQGGTLVMTELRAANNLVYATAQGPVSVGGFTAGTNFAGPNSITQNHVTAGRVPQGAVIARDMITNVTQDAQGFSYVLTTPDYKTASRLAAVLNQHFGGIARANDAETVRVNLPLKASTAKALYAGKDLPVRRAQARHHRQLAIALQLPERVPARHDRRVQKAVRGRR